MEHERGIRERGIRVASTGTALAAGLMLVAACTTSGHPAPPPGPPEPRAGQVRLVAFDSCADALAGLRAAAKTYVGSWGFGGAPRMDERAVPPGDAEGAAPQQRGAVEKAAPSYSSTNNHEADVNEPDLVKTDGRRIVTVNQGRLRVVDPATRRLTGVLDLSAGDSQHGWAEAKLLLHGDRALVLVREVSQDFRGPIRPPDVVPGGNATGEVPGGKTTGVVPGKVPGADSPPVDIVGPHLIMVDLSGTPTIVGEYRIDGSLVDARQVGATARVVIRSTPRLGFKPIGPEATEAQRLAAARAVIEQAPADAWLPRYEIRAGGSTNTGRVGCDRVSRPPTYSGATLVTLLSFDLGGTLGDGDPLTVIADGDTVYSNGSNLYLANDQRWRVMPDLLRRDAVPEPRDQVTEIYQFDIAKPGRPRYVAAGSVPGWLINQYAMSEWAGHLRVATTSGRTWGNRPQSSSTVYVLRADGRTLAETGRVGGLGKGERIYGVRFVDGTGYVVTFRQTDPLYTVDLRDPAAPKVTGELKITGYSAYLHPIDGGRLLGVGQEATARGQRQGVQVSLFDVADPARPTRVAQYEVPGSHSAAEFDPHAFLYWPEPHLVVLPLDGPAGGGPRVRPAATGGALALRLTDGGFTRAGLIQHAVGGGYVPILRSLVIDGALWTVSDAGLKASNMSTMETLSWLPMT